MDFAADNWGRFHFFTDRTTRAAPIADGVSER